MSNRFARQDARDDLFSSYNRSASPSKSKNKSRPSPYNHYGYTPPSSSDAVNAPSFGAYPGSSSASNGGLFPSSSSGSGYGVGGGGGGGNVDGNGHFRVATPNSRGQYSAAVLDELESQNDEQVGVLTSKVKMLKDLTHLIGDEIRDSTTLAEKMNDQFENSRNKIRGTMNRMLRMAQKTGVGWKAWLGFFAAVILLFWWVWLG
ncbi:protein transport protein bet1 [Neocucurbitaria cava]|uniref:Protein transport protein bet1 n=1 Tax=Neocucurbitaria cava TaxID=798079 RepID=A0A9W9CM96_9PLEO|nr:protein transport protein bet1 [Neocucurbitaria cava]